MTKFQNIDEAARAVLVAVCHQLNSLGVNYIVVGGWVPVLRGGCDKLVHPGTRDVDLLFSGDTDGVEEAVIKLLQQDFLISSKHDFQLFKIVDVNNQKFVFSVDLLHPSEGKNRKLFQDILDLQIVDQYDPKGRKHIKSIRFGLSDLVFDYELFSRETISSNNLKGYESEVVVPLLSEAGLVLSKLESALIEKRTRDAFDILCACGQRRFQCD